MEGDSQAWVTGQATGKRRKKDVDKLCPRLCILPSRRRGLFPARPREECFRQSNLEIVHRSHRARPLFRWAARREGLQQLSFPFFMHFFYTSRGLCALQEIKTRPVIYELGQHGCWQRLFPQVYPPRETLPPRSACRPHLSVILRTTWHIRQEIKKIPASWGQKNEWNPRRHSQSHGSLYLIAATARPLHLFPQSPSIEKSRIVAVSDLTSLPMLPRMKRSYYDHHTFLELKSMLGPWRCTMRVLSPKIGLALVRRTILTQKSANWPINAFYIVICSKLLESSIE